MKVLDLDMDYFMDYVATGIADTETERLSEEEYGHYVWSEQRVREFLERNLGLSKNKKRKGRIVSGHNEAIVFWQELIDKGELQVPFEVVHVDSHADLGLGYSSETYILRDLLQHPFTERVMYSQYEDCYGRNIDIGIGDYLLFAIAFRWISQLTYCANPEGEKNDYLWTTLKDFNENLIWNTPVQNTIQLVYNPEMDIPDHRASHEDKRLFLEKGVKEPEVPFCIIPNIEDVKYEGDFDFIVVAQSPNYTPASADFIMTLIREYIVEC